MAKYIIDKVTEKQIQVSDLYPGDIFIAGDGDVYFYTAEGRAYYLESGELTCLPLAAPAKRYTGTLCFSTKDFVERLD